MAALSGAQRDDVRAVFMRDQSRSWALIPATKSVLAQAITAIDDTVDLGGDDADILAVCPPAAQAQPAMVATVTPRVRTKRTVSSVLPSLSVVELAFNHSGSPANPFLLDMTCTFSKAGQPDFTVHGFFDGDGAGGQSGSVWKVRAALPAPGPWDYVTSSANSGLNGQSGQVTVAAVPGWRPKRSISPHLHLERADGGHTFTIGLWMLLWLGAFQLNIAAILEHLKTHGVNRIRGKIAGENDYGTANNKFNGSFDSYRIPLLVKCDTVVRECGARHIIWDPHILSNDDEAAMTEAQAQRWVKYCLARWGAYWNFVCALHNQADMHFGGTDSTDQQTADSQAWVQELLDYAQTVNPHGTLIHVHDPGEDHYTNGRGTNGFYYAACDDWPYGVIDNDFITKQLQVSALSAATTLAGDEINSQVLTARGLARLNAIVRQLRAGFGQAVSVDEYSFVPETPQALAWHCLTPIGCRKTHWAVTMAGAFGSTAGDAFGRGVTSDNAVWPFHAKGEETLDYLKVLADVMRSLPFWRMVPDDAVVNAAAVTIESVAYRTNWALASVTDGVFLIYSLLGGDITVDLPAGSYTATQINPRTGATSSLGTLTGSPTVLSLPTISPPADHQSGDSDWLVLIEAA